LKREVKKSAVFFERRFSSFRKSRLSVVCVLTAIRISDVIGDAVELDRRYSALFVIGVLDRIVSATELGEEIANKKPDRRSSPKKLFSF
jgi:hypothetical protein